MAKMQWMVLVVIAFGAGAACKKQDAKPAVGSGSAGSVGSGDMAGSAGSPGSAGSAGSADMAAGGMVGSGSAGSTASACAPVEVKLAKSGHTLTRGTEPPVDVKNDDGFEAGLKPFAHKCKGAVSIAAADDVSYQTVILAMDFAKKLGFVDIALSTGADVTPPAGPPPTGPRTTPDTLKETPIVVITTKAIKITTGTTSVDVGEVADVDAAKLDEAMKKAPHGKTTPRLMILQADQKTSAKTINLVVAAAKRNGFDDLLFAVKNK